MSTDQTQGEKPTDSPVHHTDTERADLTLTQLRMCAVIAARDRPSGAEISQALDPDVTASSHYYVLRTLVDAGLVVDERQSSNQRVKAFQLTDAGRAALAAECAWLCERVPGVELRATGDPDAGGGERP